MTNRYDDFGKGVWPQATEPPAETRRNGSCLKHPGCSIGYDDEWCPLCAAHAELRDYERTVERLNKSRTEAENDPANAEEIRCLKATIDVHLDTIRVQDQKLDGRERLRIEMDATIRKYNSTIVKALTRLKDQSALIGALKTDNLVLSNRLTSAREQIEAVKEVVGKVEEPTPECEHCDDGRVICPSCRGTASEGARPDDFGHRFTCRKCHGKCSVKCSECGKEAGS